MELKDVVLQTLSEIENMNEGIEEEKVEIKEKKDGISSEVEFLEALRERILVLFEGLLSPNNRAIEKKVELILNFLEYLLSLIDARLEKIRNK